MRCLACKYDLANLTEHRCPECGRAFDPKNSNTFERHATNWKVVDLVLGALMIMALMVIVVVGLGVLLHIARIVERAVKQ